MDPLDLTEDELLSFFHYNKTDMSCMDQPRLFLCRLRDYHLVSEDLFTVGYSELIGAGLIDHLCSKLF